MKNVSVNLNHLTPEQKKKLLDNHQAVIESLKIICDIIPNAVVKIMIKAMIQLADYVIDVILSQPNK